MRNLLFHFATSLLAVVITAPSIAASTNTENLHFIQIVGTGRVFVPPDKADLSLSVEIQDTTAKKARDKAANAMNSIIDAVKKQGVAEKDLQTRYVSLYPVYAPDTANRVTGYQLANQINVSVRDVSKISAIIDAAVGAGGNAARVQGINFMVDKPEAVMAEAREKAFTDARNKALQYANIANTHLGRVLQIRESSGRPPMPIPYAEVSAMKMSAEMADATPVQAGEQEMTVNVDVLFAID